MEDSDPLVRIYLAVHHLAQSELTVRAIHVHSEHRLCV